MIVNDDWERNKGESEKERVDERNEEREKGDEE